MPIKLFDTLTREILPLEPTSPAEPFRMYCCGPTVYGPAHIGNFRTFILQDVLRRALELQLGKQNVIHARNITDVDDKTIRRSGEEGLKLSAFTQKWTDKFHADCEALNLRPPAFEPRATDTIAQQAALIEKIMENGHAYQGKDGSIYFRLSSYKNYGALSHLNRDELKTQDTNSAGQANDADEYVRDNVGDFALWKARKPEDGDNFWPGPRVNGQPVEGRPGWHIECSAMIDDVFQGKTIDLHGGGVDLCFPHHENELAQSMCAHPHDCGDRFVRHWFHSTHLLVDGKKMSKSLGNLYTLDDLKQKGFSPTAVRYALIAGHYKKQLNFTLEGVAAAQTALEKIRHGLSQALKEFNAPLDFSKLIAESAQNETTSLLCNNESFFWKAFTDDLNTPKVLGELFIALGQLKENPSVDLIKQIAFACYGLGIDPFADADEKAPAQIPEDVAALGAQRWQAKQDKNWPEADRLRDELATKGFKSLDRKDGYEIVPL